MKRGKVLWSDNALNDLEIIFNFISEKSFAEAERIIAALIFRGTQLEQFPESGSRQETIKSKKDFRYLIEGNYKIVYSYSRGIIYIHTIFDCRQDPEKLQQGVQ